MQLAAVAPFQPLCLHILHCYFASVLCCSHVFSRPLGMRVCPSLSPFCDKPLFYMAGWWCGFPWSCPCAPFGAVAPAVASRAQACSMRRRPCWKRWLRCWRRLESLCLASRLVVFVMCPVSVYQSIIHMGLSGRQGGGGHGGGCIYRKEAAALLEAASKPVPRSQVGMGSGQGAGKPVHLPCELVMQWAQIKEGCAAHVCVACIRQ